AREQPVHECRLCRGQPLRNAERGCLAHPTLGQEVACKRSTRIEPGRAETTAQGVENMPARNHADRIGQVCKSGRVHEVGEYSRERSTLLTRVLGTHGFAKLISSARRWMRSAGPCKGRNPWGRRPRKIGDDRRLVVFLRRDVAPGDSANDRAFREGDLSGAI